MESTRFLFFDLDEIALQEAFEAELEQMESLAWAEYQRNLDSALAEFIINKNMAVFQELHSVADVEYQKRREEWWKSKTKPAARRQESNDDN